MHDLVGLVTIVMAFIWLSSLTNTLAKKVPGKGHKELLDEIRKLRDEIEQLRRESRQNHDVILSFDSTLQRTEQRLSHLEGHHASVPVSAPAPQDEPLRVTLGR